MTTPPQAPMADVGEMHLAHTMLRREFTLLPDLIRGAYRNDTERRAHQCARRPSVPDSACASRKRRPGALAAASRTGPGRGDADRGRHGEHHHAIAAAHDEEKAALPLAEKSVSDRCGLRLAAPDELRE